MSIGAGAIIGARATVLSDVPPYAIVVGHAGPRAAAALPGGDGRAALALEWWRYSIYDLFDAPMDSIDAALDVIEDLVASGAVAPYEGRDIVPDLGDPHGARRRARAGGHGAGQLTGNRIRSRSGPTRQPAPSGISTR